MTLARSSVYTHVYGSQQSVERLVNASVYDSHVYMEWSVWCIECLPARAFTSVYLVYKIWRMILTEPSAKFDYKMCFFRQIIYYYSRIDSRVNTSESFGIGITNRFFGIHLLSFVSCILIGTKIIESDSLPQTAIYHIVAYACMLYI